MRRDGRWRPSEWTLLLLSSRLERFELSECEVGAAFVESLVPGGIEPEARRTMDNIGATLAAHGADFDAVVKCSVFLADMGEWARFNAIYRTYFSAHFPARSALGANGLALGARVEVECLAWNP